MSEGKRPGGLTALAVLNFIFGGFGLLGLLGMVALMSLASVVEAEDPQAAEEMRKAMEEFGPLFMVALVLMAASTFLLIASGVGYLQQKRTLGRTLGSVYAILSIVSSLLTAVMMPEELNGGVDITTMVGLLYPVLTLVLLNSTFKHDLVR
jgi:hypothetical protein